MFRWIAEGQNLPNAVVASSRVKLISFGQATQFFHLGKQLFFHLGKQLNLCWNPVGAMNLPESNFAPQIILCSRMHFRRHWIHQEKVLCDNVYQFVQEKYQVYNRRKWQ